MVLSRDRLLLTVFKFEIVLEFIFREGQGKVLTFDIMMISVHGDLFTMSA